MVASKTESESAVRAQSSRTIGNDDRTASAPRLGLAVVAVLFGVDFFFDVRERDVFSWMDPYQYFDFASGVLQGTRPFDGFEVPSIFPFLLIPLLAIEPSIPASLWINFVATMLLLFALARLCRELQLATPLPWIAVLVLSSPLLLGLSRTLYIEYTLSAVVALGFGCWLRFARKMDWVSGAAFAGVLGLGFMLKSTFPLFFIAPIGAAVWVRSATAGRRDAESMIGICAFPLVIAIFIQMSVFSQSFGYYLSLGNTALPIMNLIGPIDALSPESLVFYFGEVGRTLLFALTPFLGIAIYTGIKRRSRLRVEGWAGSQALLWLWLLGPLVALIAQPAKEPRHVAPCVVPAILLIVAGIEALPTRRVRNAIFAASVGIAFVQFGAVTLGGMSIPYFLDRPLHPSEILEKMSASSDLDRYRGTPAGSRLLHWKYNQNVALIGFPANEALAMTWQAFPGVVFDLDTFDTVAGSTRSVPYRSFEDAYLFAAFDTYNRRCGWDGYYQMLSRKQIVENADFVIANGIDPARAAQQFPQHALLGTIDRGSEAIAIFRARGDTVPYRTLYGRNFLARNPSLHPSEIQVVANDLWMAASLEGDLEGRQALLREFPQLRPRQFKGRNIYWIGGYGEMIELATSRRPGRR